MLFRSSLLALCCLILSLACQAVALCGGWSQVTILTPGGKLILFLLKQNIERGQRAIAASDVLLELELVCITEFVACVHLLLENAQIVTDHDDLMKERFQRHFLRLD